MGPRTTNYQFSSQRGRLQPRGNKTRHIYISRCKSSVTSARLQTWGGTTEALSASAVAPTHAVAACLCCSASPHEHCRPHARPARGRAPALRAVDADGSAERMRHERGSAHARTTAHALRGRTSRRHLRARARVRPVPLARVAQACRRHGRTERLPAYESAT